MRHLLIYFQAYVKNNFFSLIWILVFSFFIFLVFSYFAHSQKMKKHTKAVWGVFYRIVLSLNCSFIFVMTLFGRRMGETRNFDLKPFESYFVAFAEGDMEILLQIIMNIAMYIPLGVLLPCCFEFFEKYRYIIIVAVIISLCIELIQGIFKFGLFEVDDIINNTFGALLGIGIYILVQKCKTVYMHMDDK